MDMEKVLVKDEKYKTSEEFGAPPHLRSVEELLKSSIIVLDKPAGPTSHQVAAWAKEILQVKKVGHGGTLDPQVTGVLPLLVGKAAKITKFMLSQDKEYIALMKLHKDVDEEKIRKAIRMFEGEINQLPPVKSAVKRKERKRKVYEIEVLEIEGREVLFRTRVQAGTYIRKLCHDFGKFLGVGANMQELRRIASGSFTEQDAVYLQDISEALYLYKKEGEEDKIREVLLPVERAIKNIKKIYVKDGAAGALTYGAPLYAQGVVMLDKDIKEGDEVAMLTMKGELIGMGEVKKDALQILKAKSGVVVMPNSIIMDTGIYPKSWEK